ncbi:hemolysin family protein [Thermomonas paludicola]|uniref:hemolysin family protein n=1 Tax=Thermomonas paludicola TaxID=2884874 RepID=UPI002115133D|nr:hemolysin family protein [Thermomonas paludicola]
MLELLIVLALILLNAFFAMSEMAVMTSRKSRLRQLAQGSRRAHKALELAEHPESFLSAVQLWITLLSLLTGYFGGESMGSKIADPLAGIPMFAPYADRIGFIGGFLVMLFLFGLIGELVPKRIGTLQPERIASLVAYPMHFFAIAAKPFVVMLSTCTRLVLRMLRLSSGNAQAVTEEEIQMLVSEGHEQGVIDLDERNMVNRVMRLGDRTADSLMTPRTRISWLDASASLAENLALMQEDAFSRYPVYRGNDSDVVGLLEVKTLLDELGKPQPDLFRDVRPALFVSESTHAMKLLEILREEQQSMALVVDEYGDIQGLVTVSDIVDAVIGRLQTGTDADAGEALVVTRDDGSLLVDGGLHVEELRELTGERLADAEELDYRTAAGLVIAHFGRIPHVGEHFRIGAWKIEVVDLDGPRIDKLLLQRDAQPARDDA